MSKTLFLSPPSFDGFDGGAGSRYQARREVTSFWYPTWLAQPAALVPNSTLLDCPPHDVQIKECLERAKGYDHVIIHTSTPSLKNDSKVAEAIKQNRPETKIGFVGAHAAVLPGDTLKASWAIDWVGRKEFDYTCKEVAEGHPLETVAGLSYRDKEGKIRHNPERELIPNMDALPWVADVYRRDLQIEKYFIGYLLHPYVSLYTGRGCPAQCTFCLWPQTIGGHKYRVRSPQNVADEMAYMKQVFPQVREFFFDDDTFTANLPRAREIAKKLAPLGLTWSCNSRANLDYDTIKSFKDTGLRLFLVGYESGNDDILTRVKKGVTLDEMRRFTRACHQAGVVIHGTFVLGLPIESQQSIENTIRFAQELDVFSIQVSLAAPYPGTELYEMARQNGWFVKKDKADLVEEDGFQQSALEYPGLSKDEIFEAVDRFYRTYYLRPKPILRIIKTMLEDKDVLVRRCREGYEFFKSLRQRKQDLAQARASTQFPAAERQRPFFCFGAFDGFVWRIQPHGPLNNTAFTGEVEFCATFTRPERISHVLFDFDGTLSLIRQGWPEVMVPMFVEMLPALPGESDNDRKRLCYDDIMRLNGKQTIYQMIQLADRIRERGGSPSEPLWYKHEYLRRLDERISHRLESLRSGKIRPDDLLVFHARALMDELARRGLPIYLASGTDEKFVKLEAELLDLSRYFGRHIYGALDDYKQFSKKMVIDRILRENNIPGAQLLSFGDGYVEIQNTKEVGGLAVAVASDEANNGSGQFDRWKYDRLKGVGADVIIPDFRDASALLTRLL